MGNKSHRRNREIRWDWILVGIGFVLLVIYGCLQYKNIKDEQNYENTIVRLDELKELPSESKPEEAQEEEQEEQEEQEVSYQKLFDANEDMIGWLHIPETDIDYPVMQTMDDEEYYLYRNFFKEKDKNGTLILDTDSDISKTSNNLIIHGHNMKSGAMFGSLQEYEDAGYAKEHSRIFFYTKNEKRVYEIIAVFRSKVYTVEDQVFKYYQFFEAKNQKEFEDFYSNIKKLSEFDTGVTAEYGDEFITLSTCQYHTKNGRLAVIGKRIAE